MKIQETLKELLETRRASLIENYSNSLHRDRDIMQRWASAAEKVIRENLQITPSHDGEREYVQFRVGFGQIFEENTPENQGKIDNQIFDAATNYYILADLRAKKGLELENFVYGSWAKDMFNNIRSGTIRTIRTEENINGYTKVEYTSRWATDEEIQKRAEEMADDALADFVNKMTKKMEAIGEVKSATIDYEWGNLFQTCLNVEFENGIRFNMVNSIVYKTSSRGLPFHQFPARFNAVTLNGVPQKGCASEAAVKRLAKSL